MKPNKIRNTKDILKRFDENAEMLEGFGTKTKEFTPLIKILELLVKQMKIVRRYPKLHKNKAISGRKDSPKKHRRD